MSNIPLKTIKFPGLDDTYTVPVVDNTLATAGAAADAKKTGDEITSLKQDFSHQSNGKIKETMSLNNINKYYSAANTISSGSNNKCRELLLPSNLKRFEFTISHLLPSSLSVMYLLDENKTLVAEIKGRTSGINYVNIAEYPTAVYAQCNVFGIDGYYYSGIDMVYRPNADKQDIETAELSAKRIGIPVSCTFVCGQYIKKDGTLVNTEKNWLISSPIHLNSGEELFVKCSGYIGIISIITRCDSSGNIISPVVISSCVESEVKEYSYQAVGSEYVKICLDSKLNWSAVISTVKSGITNDIYRTGTLIYGYWCSSAESSGIAATTDGAYIKIPVTSDTKYLTVTYPNTWDDISNVSNLVTGRALCLDSNDDIISSMKPQDYVIPNAIDGLYYATFPIESGSSYFCITTKLSTWDETNSLIVINGKEVTYLATTINSMGGIEFSDEKLRKLYTRVDKENWSDLTWLLVGDSLTDKNLRAKISYYDYIADETGVKFITKGHNGQGYKRGTWFYTALTEVDEDDFDFCTFFGSGNDCYYYDSQTQEIYPYTDAEWPGVLGTVSDSGTSTICGCINGTFDKFIELFPLKKFGVVTPTPWAEQSNADGTINGTHMDDYVNKIIEICKNRGIPVLDLYHESGLRPWNEDFLIEYYNEDGVQDTGVHPNSKGHKWIYPMFKQFLKQFIIN